MIHRDSRTYTVAPVDRLQFEDRQSNHPRTGTDTDETYRYGVLQMKGNGDPIRKKTRENAELTNTEEKQKHETEPNSMKRSNESEYASSDLTPEEQSEKSG